MPEIARQRPPLSLLTKIKKVPSYFTCTHIHLLEGIENNQITLECIHGGLDKSFSLCPISLAPR